jgi:hypothetical protein
MPAETKEKVLGVLFLQHKKKVHMRGPVLPLAVY